MGKYKKSFFKSFLMMTGGVPSAKTICRIFSKLNPASLEYYSQMFFNDCIKTNSYKKDILVLDVKQHNGSGRQINEIREAIRKHWGIEGKLHYHLEFYI